MKYIEWVLRPVLTQSSLPNPIKYKLILINENKSNYYLCEKLNLFHSHPIRIFIDYIEMHVGNMVYQS